VKVKVKGKGKVKVKVKGKGKVKVKVKGKGKDERLLAEKAVQYLLCRCIGFFRVIALLAASDAIAACGPTAARNRNNVIHRKIFRTYVLAAIMAHALRQLSAPPIRGAQLSRLRPFTLHMNGIGIEIQPIFCHIVSFCAAFKTQ
jgi:hypothetical protein